MNKNIFLNKPLFWFSSRIQLGMQCFFGLVAPSYLPPLEILVSLPLSSSAFSLPGAILIALPSDYKFHAHIHLFHRPLRTRSVLTPYSTAVGE